MGPTFVRRRRRRGGAASTGASTPGAGSTAVCTHLGPRRPRRAEGARGRGRGSLPRADRARGRRDPRRRRGDGAEHRGVPAQPEPQSRLSREQIEQALFDYLGAEKVIWLGRGVYNDETDGHVDNLACFVRPGVVLLSWSARTAPIPSTRSHATRSTRLERATDARGRSIEVDPHPLAGPADDQRGGGEGVRAVPGTLPRRAGERLAASYVNFYLATRRIVFPLLDERFDAAAEEVLRGLLSRARARRRSRARDPARRRRHPLHHPAGPGRVLRVSTDLRLTVSRTA